VSSTLAKNHISPRRASVLAHINGLLLRTLPAIDADNAAGISNPTEPSVKRFSIPVPGENASPASAPATGSVNSWDSSLPEPDAKKKPS
jgi:hypothetical protein